MFDIKPLEEEWQFYKKEKRKPWYRLFIFVLFVGLIIFFSLFNKTNFSLLNKPLATLNHFFLKKDLTIKKMTYQVLINPPLYVLEKKRENISIKTSKESNTNKKKSNILINIPLLDDSSKEVKIIKEENNRKKLDINIVDSDDIGVYKSLEKRFLETHDIDDALFLAKSYYLNQNYKKSEYWALQTNKLDPMVEESLLIFVKSKVKLGKKNEGIAILISYLKRTNSKEGKKLLYIIKKNKL